MGEDTEEGLDEDLGDVILGLIKGRFEVGLTPFSRSLRWFVYELRLGSLYRSTVRTFP